MHPCSLCGWLCRAPSLGRGPQPWFVEPWKPVGDLFAEFGVPSSAANVPFLFGERNWFLVACPAHGRCPARLLPLQNGSLTNFTLL